MEMPKFHMVGNRMAKSCERNKDGNFNVEYWNGEKVTIAADDVYKKPISVSTMKTTSIHNCQSCGKPFAPGDIVYFVPLDNNIVCPECAYKHDRREKRIVEGESICSPATIRYNTLTDILRNSGVTLNHAERRFLMWFSTWDNETAETLGGLMEKCLKVGADR